jgi:hypothetical protein
MRGFLLLVCAISARNVTAAEETPGQPASGTRFDGVWSVTVVCDDYKDADVGAKGYTLRMLGRIRNGNVEAERGKLGEPGSLRYRGRIQADGAAELTRAASPETRITRLVGW